jgi:hypothetical protein
LSIAAAADSTNEPQPGETAMEASAPVLDHEASNIVARRVRARVRRCWHNAATAVHHLGDGALYVEGWAVVNQQDPYVIEHGWCEVDGRVIDPSYTEYVTRGVTRLEPPLAYFPGLRFSADQAAAALTGRRLPMAWSWRAGKYERAFRAAWHEVLRRSAATPAPPTRLVNCRREGFDEFIGRPSRWSNPYHIGHDGSRDEVIDMYRDWLIRQPLLLRDVKMLRGKILGCECPPRRCHGDVLVQLTNLTV